MAAEVVPFLARHPGAVPLRTTVVGAVERVEDGICMIFVE